MKKGCGLTFLVWAALVAVYARLAFLKIHELAPSLVIGVLGGTFAGMLLASIVGLFRGGSDSAAFKRLRRGDPPRGGRLEAASGPIRALGAPLEAPLTGRPCVMYEYTVKPKNDAGADFAGVAMTPSAIDSTRGPARVLGWPVLDQFPNASSFDHHHGEIYLKTVNAERIGVGKLLGAFSDMAADDDGQLRRDFRSENASASLHGKYLEEKIVQPGEVVTLLGIWDEARGGFTPGGKASLNRIFPGALDSVEKSVATNPWKQLAIACVFFLALHAILVPMWFLAGTRGGSSSASTSSSGRPSVFDETDCGRIPALVSKGADPNERRDGQTALMHAARERDLACVEALVAAGARVQDTDPKGETAFTQAVMAGREDVAEALRKHGASDFRVTKELGRPVTERSESLAAVKRYLAAVHAGDFDTMASLLQNTSRFALEHEKENLPTWQEFRPKDPHLVEGWETAVSATITVQGKAAVGSGAVSFDVEKTMDGWKIAREWFPK